MPSNKDRLYLALYARGGVAKMPGREDTYVYGDSLWRLNPLSIIRYHWALLMGPKSDRKDDEGVRYHARERVRPEGGSEWVFEELTISMMPTQMILVRIMLAKIEQADRLRQLLRQIPIRQGEEGWNCVLWVKEALDNLERSKDVIGTCVLDWESVREAALSYCQKKKDQHRFDGKGKFDTSQVPTYDLIQGKESIA